MEWLIAGCPRLADLTLEACEQLAELDVVGASLRRLALRCCHDLAAVAADSSELRAFEYHGAVPAPSFLTLHGGGGACRIASCKLDFCGAEATGAPELARLAQSACTSRPRASAAAAPRRSRRSRRSATSS